MPKIKLVDGTELEATKITEGQPYFIVVLGAGDDERTLKVHADKVLWWESEEGEKRERRNDRF